jgi:hypothetical protein
MTRSRNITLYTEETAITSIYIHGNTETLFLIFDIKVDLYLECM